MARFNLENYADVKTRIQELIKEFPGSAIQTKLLSLDGPRVIVEARVFRTREDVIANVFTNGMASEIEGSSNVNTTSFIENAETSAIGRALANMGYGTEAGRPSREEMLKAERTKKLFEDGLAYVGGAYVTLSDDLEGVIGGESVKLKQYIKENGEAIKTQPSVARVVVAALEVATGIPFESDAE